MNTDNVGLINVDKREDTRLFLALLSAFARITFAEQTKYKG